MASKISMSGSISRIHWCHYAWKLFYFIREGGLEKAPGQTTCARNACMQQAWLSPMAILFDNQQIALISNIPSVFKRISKRAMVCAFAHEENELTTSASRLGLRHLLAFRKWNQEAITGTMEMTIWHERSRYELSQNP